MSQLIGSPLQLPRTGFRLRMSWYAMPILWGWHHPTAKMLVRYVVSPRISVLRSNKKAPRIKISSCEVSRTKIWRSNCDIHTSWMASSHAGHGESSFETSSATTQMLPRKLGSVTVCITTSKPWSSSTLMRLNRTNVWISATQPDFFSSGMADHARRLGPYMRRSCK